MFRPCYIRAFADAKDYKADSGKVLEGTKKATADDFVSRGEFKIFCGDLIIYATMYDAFSKIDQKARKEGGKTTGFIDVHGKFGYDQFGR